MGAQHRCRHTHIERDADQDVATLARMMVGCDLRMAEKELVLRKAGHEEAPRGGYR